MSAIKLPHITAEDAEQEPDSARLFGPSYDQRQAEFAANANQPKEPTPLIAAPRPRAYRRWPDASKLRGKRVLVDLEAIEGTYRELVGDACLSRPGMVKQVRVGYARVAWGATQAWLNVEGLTVL